MQRRQLFQVALAVPVLAACKDDTAPKSDVDKRLAPLRKVPLDASAEPAMVFVPLKRT